MSRTLTRILTLALLAALALTLGCSPADDATDSGDDAADEVQEFDVLTVDFGTLATEDALPFWVAQEQGIFEDHDLVVNIESFQAAVERDTALTAGTIDCEMGDLIAAALLENGGQAVSVTTLMLGADPGQGRFGIVTKPESAVASLDELAGVAIGTSTGTIQEYVVDSLFAQAGVDAADVVKEEVAKVPVRFELLTQGQLEVAALPEPLLSLAEFMGGTIVADDTSGDNITQTVLIANDEWLETPEGAEAMTRLLAAWDDAVDVINADPDAFRSLLLENARLPEPLAESYPVNTYPTAQLPTEQMVADVVDWMRDVDLLNNNIPYHKLVWEE